MLAVCARIAGGELVKDAAAAEGVHHDVVRRWAVEDDELGRLYARAREDQAHAMAEECIRIADGTDGDAEARLEAMVASMATVDDDGKERLLAGLAQAAIQRDRLRLDARKWLTSKIAPRHYGERTTTELTGPDGQPLAPPQPPQIFLIGGQKVAFQ
jgi:hypothetical protein